MANAPGPGKGNRTTGPRRSQRNERGRRGTLGWRKDEVILRRLAVVADLLFQPPATALDTLNEWLRRQGQDPVSIETLFRDRQRVRELLRENARTGAEAHIEEFTSVYEDARRRMTRVPDRHGQAWAAVAAVAIRAREDISRIDGSWSGGGVDVSVTIDASSFGKSPAEQLASGEIDESTYLSALRVLHSASTPDQPRLVGSSGDEDDQEGWEQESPQVRQPSGPQIRRGGSGSRGGTARRQEGHAADEIPLPHVVDWDQDEIERNGF